MALIEFKNVTKQFFTGEHTINALDDASFEIEKGEFTVILGPSGAGKSTLLNLLGGMEYATQGQILIDGVDIAKFNDAKMTKYRAKDVGFVFQFYNLIPTLTAIENIQIVAEITDAPIDAKKVIDDVGLSDHKYQFPLSFRVVNSKEFQLRVLFAKIRKCCFATSRPVRLTAKRACRFCRFCSL